MANLIIFHPIQAIFIHYKPRITTEIRGLQFHADFIKKIRFERVKMAAGQVMGRGRGV